MALTKTNIIDNYPVYLSYGHICPFNMRIRKNCDFFSFLK